MLVSQACRGPNVPNERRNVAGSGGYSGGYEGHFRAHNGGTQLSTLFDYVVGARILAGHFRVGYEASVGFMVGEYIGSNTGVCLIDDTSHKIIVPAAAEIQHIWSLMWPY